MRRLIRAHGPCTLVPHADRSPFESLVRAVAHQQLNGTADFQEEREVAQLRRLWGSIELEIIRVLEASNQLKESPDYELHRLTEKTPAFFDDTVRRHVESLEKELRLLESEAEELAKEIEELTGEAVCGIG